MYVHFTWEIEAKCFPVFPKNLSLDLPQQVGAVAQVAWTVYGASCLWLVKAQLW